MSVPISNVVRRVVFAPSGTGPYAFTFEILAATDIQVYKGDTLLTLTTDYTVTINANGTGEVTLVATAGTDNITIVGARTIQRTTDFVTGGDLFANSLNTELDSLTIFTQQNSEANVRSIKAPVTDPTTINMTLPTKTARAGKYLSFNSSTGNPEVVNSVVDITAVAANSTNINTVAGQISPVNNISTVAGAAANIATVAGIAANVTTVAGISGNVTTVAGISADVTAVAGDATDIGAVAAISADVQALGPIAADITAVAGIGSADIASVAAIDTDVTAVAGIAANVTTVAGIAANVTTVAGISADVTTVATNVADITNFSDVYLGPAATDPATRNDSSALQAGDLYFDTVADVMKVYTGSAWVAAYVSGTGFVDLASAQTITGVKTFDNGLNTDTISEETSAAGVTVDGVLLKDSGVVTGAGTVSAPVYSTTGDLNTGIFFPAADTIGLAAGGVEAARLVSGLLSVPANSTAASAVRLYEDTDNGTNYVELTAPASVGSDRVITFPDATTTVVGTDTTQTLTNKSIVATQLTGTIAAARLPAGSVLQVVSTTKTDTFTTTSTSFTTITGLTASITPSSATSKIMIFVSVTGSQEVGTNDAFIGLFRDSTQIALGDAAGSRTRYSFLLNTSNAGWSAVGSVNFLDSPATTSAISYSVRARVPSSGTLYINRGQNDADSGSGAGRTVSSITVMEIAA